MSIILIALKESNVPENLRQRAEQLCPDSRVVITNDPEQIEPLLDQIEIAAARFPIQWLPKAPNLRWFQQWGAGTDWLLRHPEIAQQDFKLTNASGVSAIPISEHILAFMLAFTRRLPDAMKAQSLRRWNRFEDAPAFELAGKTMLLVGVGAIGRRTASIAEALGMRVIGVRSDPSNQEPGVERMVGTEQMLEVLPEADFVVLTIPLTNQTRGMVDRAFFDQMKPTAYFINIGRGGTVHEDALIEALLTGKI